MQDDTSQPRLSDNLVAGALKLSSADRLDTLRGELADLADNVRDMAQRVINNGGEPNYASEKMARATRSAIKALAVIDEIFLWRWADTPEQQADFRPDKRTREIVAEAGRVYASERDSWR